MLSGCGTKQQAIKIKTIEKKSLQLVPVPGEFLVPVAMPYWDFTTDNAYTRDVLVPLFINGIKQCNGQLTQITKLQPAQNDK